LQYDVSDPFSPKRPGRCASAGLLTERPTRKIRTSRWLADANGGSEPRRKRIYFTNSLYAAWDEQFYPTAWAAGCQTDAGRNAHCPRRKLFYREQRLSGSPDPLEGGDPRAIPIVFREELWPWLTLFGLGAFMGSIRRWDGCLLLDSMQEQKRIAVLRALPPIALGTLFPSGSHRRGSPGSGYRATIRSKNYGCCDPICFWILSPLSLTSPELGRHAVGFGDLTLWSFVMASAHGAGLMQIPYFLYHPTDACTTHGSNGLTHCTRSAASNSPSFSTPSLLTSQLPSILGYLLVMACGDVGLREARCRNVAPRLVQRRFVLDARVDGHWRIYPLPLIWGRVRPRYIS